MQIETSPQRLFLKAFSWRILATLTTMVIAYLVTGKIDLAIEIGFIEFFLKMAIYSFHERVWDKVRFGIEIKRLTAD